MSLFGKLFWPTATLVNERLNEELARANRKIRELKNLVEVQRVSIAELTAKADAQEVEKAYLLDKVSLYKIENARLREKAPKRGKDGRFTKKK